MEALKLPTRPRIAAIMFRVQISASDEEFFTLLSKFALCDHCSSTFDFHFELFKS